MEPQLPSPTSPAAATPPPASLSQSVPRPNLVLAIVAGIVAAIVGAIAWAVITVSAEYQIGFMAIGVGLLVGFAVRLGNGTGKVFGIIGAILALLGCVAGNFLSMVGFAAKAQHVNVLSALGAIDFARVPDVMAQAFNAMDLVFYGIAVYEAYRFSQRKPQPTVGTEPRAAA